MRQLLLLLLALALGAASASSAGSPGAAIVHVKAGGNLQIASGASLHIGNGAHDESEESEMLMGSS